MQQQTTRYRNSLFAEITSPFQAASILLTVILTDQLSTVDSPECLLVQGFLHLLALQNQKDFKKLCHCSLSLKHSSISDRFTKALIHQVPHICAPTEQSKLAVPTPESGSFEVVSVIKIGSECVFKCECGFQWNITLESFLPISQSKSLKEEYWM